MVNDVIEERNRRIKRLDRLAWFLTAIVWLSVGAMRSIKIHTSTDLSFLAGFNALCNTGVTFALIAAYFFIKKNNVEWHRRSIYIALTLSALFLLSYIGYHITNEEILFCKTGTIRYLYLFILFSHIGMAAFSLPFILLTFIRGYTVDYIRHTKLSKWVYWLWLYVAVTGPVVYLLLFPCRTGHLG